MLLYETIEKYAQYISNYSNLTFLDILLKVLLKGCEQNLIL